MDLKDRIGIDLGRRIRLEEGIEWAARADVRYINVQLDTEPNALDTFDAARAMGVRAACEKHGMHLGLHTLSAVNIADCFRLGKEVHLRPGAGDLDFAHMFTRVEGKGFTGHYTNAFGSLDDMLAARDDLAAKAAAVGVG